MPAQYLPIRPCRWRPLQAKTERADIGHRLEACNRHTPVLGCVLEHLGVHAPETVKISLAKHLQAHSHTPDNGLSLGLDWHDAVQASSQSSGHTRSVSG